MITCLESPVAAPLLGPTLLLSALRLKVPIFWDLIPCTAVNRCQSFGGACCMYLRSVYCRTVFYNWMNLQTLKFNKIVLSYFTS